MVNRAQLRELAPHYVANLALIFGTLFAVRAVVGDTGLLVELGIVMVVVLVYPPMVRALGVEPSLWEKRDR